MTAAKKKVALLAGALIFGLATLECGARIFVPTQRVFIAPVASGKAYKEKEYTFRRGASTERFLVYSRTGLRLRPSTQVTLENERLSGRNIVIRTNSLGYRGPELGHKTAPRILFLGDSITLADYLHEKETFVHLVGEQLATAGHAAETVNSGVGTISLGSELAILRETGLSIEPDVVLLNFYLNDFRDSPGVYTAKLPGYLAWSQAAQLIAGRFITRPDIRGKEIAEWEQELAEQLETAAGNYRTDQRAFNRLILRRMRDWGGVWSPRAWDKLRPLFGELHRLSSLHGFKLAIVAHPVREQVQTEFVDDYPQKQLADIARDLDVPLLDLLPLLREHWQDNEERLFFDQCHHTPLGSKLVANWIAEFLMDSSLLPR